MNIILGTMTFGDQVDVSGADAMIDAFQNAGHRHLDTARMYCEGRTETLLGTILPPARRQGLHIATKVNPWVEGGLTPHSVNRQFAESLDALGAESVDLLYLHSPDLDTPIDATLEACYRLFDAGKFRQFGLSNYAAWQVAEIAETCERNDWMRPLVYQGMYNALTRDVERELFACVRNYGLAFYAYNPLAGGLLTGKHGSYEADPGAGRFTRFDAYRERYWKRDYFEVLEGLKELGARYDITPAQIAIRWLLHHSKLADELGDGVIFGVSSLAHLYTNLETCAQGPLPEELVVLLDQGWELVRPTCIKYFRP